MFRPVFLLSLPAPGSMLDRPATPVLIWYIPNLYRQMH